MPSLPSTRSLPFVEQKPSPLGNLASPHQLSPSFHIYHVTNSLTEAEPEVGDDYKISGRNITALEHFVKSTNIMDVIFTRAPKSARFGISQPGDELIHLVQLVLSALALRIEHRTVWSFDVSQRMAYMSMLAEPLFKGPSGTDVNIDWALHVVNFFRYHALRSEEGTLHGPWMDLTEQNDGLGLPQLMKAGLSNLGPASIGQNWKGTYGKLLRPLLSFSSLTSTLQPSSTAARSGKFVTLPVDKAACSRIRTSKMARVPSRYDIFYHNSSALNILLIFTQRLKLEFPPTAKFNWPQLFEGHLDSVGFHHDRLDRLSGLNLPRVTRAQHSRMQAYGPQTLTYTKSRRFDGIGYDDEDFYGSGWINPLPAQHGIPGFKRMTMMKFFQDENGLVDANALWAYEGVVLPGDQIIVGRWWSPEGLDRESRQNVYSGPFILWNVDSLVQHKKDQQGEELDALLNP